MAIYANLRDYNFESDVDDIRGADVYGANNEKLGEVDDVIFDPDSGDLRYVVIDTGGWLTSNKFLVPAREIMNTVEGENHFRVNLTREQIERFPAYDESALSSEDRWQEYEQRYEEARELKDGPVLHREGSTHTITPQPEELPASGGAGIRTSSPRPIAMDQPRFGASSDSEDPAHTAHLGVGPQTAHRRVANRTETQHLPHDDQHVVGADPTLTYDRSENVPKENMSRTQFAADGTLRSEYDNQNQIEERDRQESIQPEGGRRFREFQDRLRREREEILRKRRERDAA